MVVDYKLTPRNRWLLTCFKQQTWGVKRIYAIQIVFEQHGATLTYRSGFNMLLVYFSQHLDKTTELRFEIYV
jgi:hypothetical protein